jgi:hypothetical protein
MVRAEALATSGERPPPVVATGARGFGSNSILSIV